MVAATRIDTVPRPIVREVQSRQQVGKIARVAAEHIHIEASLSTAYGCRFESESPDAVVRECVAWLVDLEVQRLSLHNTGIAQPLPPRAAGSTGDLRLTTAELR